MTKEAIEAAAKAMLPLVNEDMDEAMRDAWLADLARAAAPIIRAEDAKLIEQLQAKVSSYAKQLDDLLGTPCAQIRIRAEVEAEMVAWLRNMAGRFAGNTRNIYLAIVDVVERGDHRAGKD